MLQGPDLLVRIYFQGGMRFAFPPYRVNFLLVPKLPLGTQYFARLCLATLHKLVGKA